MVCNTGSTCLKSRIYGNILDFRQLLLLLLPYGRINSRMTSYLKIFVLIDFHFQDAIFPFSRAAPYGRRARFKGKAERARGARASLALDPRRSSAAARKSGVLVRSATGEGPHEAKFPFNSFQTLSDQKFGEQPGGQSENFPRGVHSCLKSEYLLT